MKDDYLNVDISYLDLKTIVKAAFLSPVLIIKGQATES
jgi:hypothetical protein